MRGPHNSASCLFAVTGSGRRSGGWLFLSLMTIWIGDQGLFGLVAL